LSNLAEMFSNKGSAPNCMVMFAVDIKGVFLEAYKYRMFTDNCL